MKKMFVLCLAVLFVCTACGTFFKGGKVNPNVTSIAQNSIVIAEQVLNELASFYNGLIFLKKDPTKTADATTVLSSADSAATILGYAKAGGNVTDSQLNTAIGQVQGARLMYLKLSK